MNLVEDYTFRDDIKADTVPIELMSGPYKGIVIRYTTVGIDENEDQTSATLRFEYEFHEKMGMSEAKLRSDPKFNTHIGLVLNALILEAIDSSNGEQNATRKTDPEEFVKE